MVMESIEGETLATLIEKEALPLDQTLKLATQIADALTGHRPGKKYEIGDPRSNVIKRIRGAQSRTAAKHP